MIIKHATEDHATAATEGRLKRVIMPVNIVMAKTYCPGCEARLIHTNTGNGKVDTYCEECGWPDEVREPNPNCVIKGKRGQKEKGIKSAFGLCLENKSQKQT